MRIEIEIPDYDPFKGIETEWDMDYILKTEMQDGRFILKANSGALKELALHLLTLTQEGIEIGSHIDYFSWNYGLESGSIPFVIKKIAK